MNATQAIDNTPFFLVGCVRSGTTLLRDLLRLHARLECPEETHFFRWADPFGTARFRAMNLKSDLMKKHRELDGVPEDRFLEIFEAASDRKALMEAYGAAFLEARGNPGGRWFDKTPQNVYGIPLIADAWPQARFVHIHRHPLNVVASLLEGKVMPAHDLDGAINYWNEAAAIIQQARGVLGDRLKDVSYETLTSDPASTFADLLEYLGEDVTLPDSLETVVHPEKNKYRGVLSEEQVGEVLERTVRFLGTYGYTEPA